MNEQELLKLLKKNTFEDHPEESLSDIDNFSTTITTLMQETKSKEESGSSHGFEDVFQSSENEQVKQTGSGFMSGAFYSAEALEQGILKDKENGNRPVRVAAYIRVSSTNPDQEDSYELQERYFSSLLEENPAWISVGVYSDYAISGTTGAKRTGFQRLLRHCREGKIDRIITKSISRFARNTTDFLTAMDTLKENHVTILFEKENLDTADPTSDFIMTTLGAIAQEESRSISENIRWGNKKRFPKGEVRNLEIYGYRYVEGEDAYVTTESGYKMRQVEIVEEEAEVVQRIFQEVIDGKPYATIARELNREGIPAPNTNWTKKHKRQRTGTDPARGELRDDVEVGWTGEKIRRIVKSERYTGDVLIQKRYTQDYLTHKTFKNEGEMPQYLIHDHHPAIISRETFEEAQKVAEITRNRNGGGSTENTYPFSKRLICGHCGKFYTTRNRNLHPIWYCPTSELNNGTTACKAEKVYEEQIVRMFRKAVIERYKLLSGTVDEDVLILDMADEAHDGSRFTEAGTSFVEQMKARLKDIEDSNFVERDRAFLKRQLLALQMEGDRLKKQLRLAKSRKETLKIRHDKLQDDSVTQEDLEAADQECVSLEDKISTNENEIQEHSKRMDHMERYWAELEEDHIWREEALEWMDTLPKGKEGTVQFLDGLTAGHVKAFALSITIYSPYKYSIHWFDDTTTEVEMDTNIEDYRCTASYYDGSQMRKNPRYRLRKKPATS